MVLCFHKKQYLLYLERHVLKVKLAHPRRLLQDYRYTRQGRQSSERVVERPHTCSTHVKHRALNAETVLFERVVCDLTSFYGLLSPRSLQEAAKRLAVK